MLKQHSGHDYNHGCCQWDGELSDREVPYRFFRKYRSIYELTFPFAGDDQLIPGAIYNS
jgi:hypothetical protein